MPTIYHYHPETKEYMEPEEADYSPVNPNTPIIPAFATDIKPPTVNDKQKAVFIGGKWVIKAKRNNN
jgi:hypothetical protein